MNNRIEGLGVDLHQARFTGTFDVSEEDDEALSLDKVVVFLVAARSGKIEHTIRDNGDVVAKRILKISEAMPLTGEDKEEALRQMNNFPDPNQGSFTLDLDVQGSSAEISTVVDIDTDDDEPEVFQPISHDPSLGEVEVIGQVGAHKRDSQLSKFLQESYQ